MDSGMPAAHATLQVGHQAPNEKGSKYVGLWEQKF